MKIFTSFISVGIIFFQHHFLINEEISSYSRSQSNRLTFLSDASPTSQWKQKYQGINTIRLLVPLVLNKQSMSINQGSLMAANSSSTTSLSQKQSMVDTLRVEPDF